MIDDEDVVVVVENKNHPQQVPEELAPPLYCSTFALTYFFHLTSFYWMFLEGRIVTIVAVCGF